MTSKEDSYENKRKTALYHDCNYPYSDYSVLSDSLSQPHKMNSGYVNGNSAGNLYNGGLSVKATALFSSVILPTTTDSIP